MPLRSDACPNGLPKLCFVDRIKVSQSNKLYHLTAQVIKFAVARGILICIENPQYSLFWATTFWVQVAGLLKYTILHSCQYGSSRQKRTMLAHNHRAFSSICKQCAGESKNHRHLPWGLTTDNRFATSEETAYPFPLARDIAAAFVEALVSAGMVPPPESFSELQSQSEHVLQAVRAQSGFQPKVSKLPPLVPEFAKIVTRVVPVNSDIENIPNAKKLSSKPTESSRMKGGDLTCTPLECDAAVAAESLTTETWGVFHSPEEFVAKAVKTGHPHGMKQCLPEVLKNAISANKEFNIAQRAKKRTHKLKQWMVWAEELTEEEKELKSSMHVDVRAIVTRKRIKLWEKLLLEAS